MNIMVVRKSLHKDGQVSLSLKMYITRRVNEKIYKFETFYKGYLPRLLFHGEAEAFLTQQTRGPT